MCALLCNSRALFWAIAPIVSTLKPSQTIGGASIAWGGQRKELYVTRLCGLYRLGERFLPLFELFKLSIILFGQLTTETPALEAPPPVNHP